MPMELVRALPYDHPYRWDGTPVGGVNLWRPLNLLVPASVWLDAEDTTTITLNGATVSQWNDKSGNARNVSQATAADQPTYSATGLNGKPILTFDGSDLLSNTAPGALLRNVPGATLAAVVNYTNNTAGRAVCSVATASAGQTRSALLVNNTTATGYLVGGRRLDANSFQISGSTTFSAATTVLQFGVLDYANSDAFSYVNGTLEATNTAFQTSGNTSDTNSAALYVGASATGGTNPLIGSVAEIVIVPAALSADQRQRLEGYFAWKWALEASLPVGHPYKNTPPTV